MQIYEFLFVFWGPSSCSSTFLSSQMFATTARWALRSTAWWAVKGSSWSKIFWGPEAKLVLYIVLRIIPHRYFVFSRRGLRSRSRPFGPSLKGDHCTVVICEFSTFVSEVAVVLVVVAVDSPCAVFAFQGESVWSLAIATTPSVMHCGFEMQNSGESLCAHPKRLVLLNAFPVSNKDERRAVVGFLRGSHSRTDCCDCANLVAACRVELWCIPVDYRWINIAD